MAVKNFLEEAVATYRKCLAIPAVSHARISAKKNPRYITVESIWSQKNLECGEKRMFSRMFYLTRSDDGEMEGGKHFEENFPRQLTDEQLFCETPSGQFRAVLRKIPATKKKEENQNIEIWTAGHCMKCYDINVLDKHGKVYDDDQFSSFCWSPCERYLLYVAEKKLPKTSSYFEMKKDEKSEEKVEKEFYQACVMRNPVTNFASLITSSDIPDWSIFQSGEIFSFGKIPTAELHAKLLDKSPIKYADKVQTPTLILLGGVDLRVPPIQGKEYYKILKCHKVDVRLLLYPEDSHPLNKVETEADAFMNIVNWFASH